MVSSQGKNIFRLHLSISVVLLLLTLGTLSLCAAFYLGMITGKSMQRPPEKSVIENEFNFEKTMSDEDLKFFGLGEVDKNKDILDVEEMEELKTKTEELSKISETNKTKPPKSTKLNNSKVVKQNNLNIDQKIEDNVNSPLPKVSETKNLDTEIGTSLKTGNEVFFTIQVLASRNNKNAKNLVRKLKKDGFTEAFIFKHSAGDKTLYRVRVGKVPQNETKVLASKLKKLKYIDSIQVSRF